MQLIKSSIIYLGSSVLNKAIPFLLLPLLTEYLSPEEYGVLAIFQLMIAFYSAFIGMAMHTNISKNFFNYTKKQLSVLIANILFILTITASLALGITFLTSLWYDNLFSVPSNWVMVIPVISFMFMVNTLNLTLLRNEEKALLFGAFEVVNTAVNMGVTIVLLLFYNYGWYSQALGILTAYTLFFFISLAYMHRNGYVTFKFDKVELRKVLNLSIPLIPHVVGGIIIGLSDRFFIERMISLEMVGIYSVGYMFGMVVVLFTDAFIKAWSPWFYRMLSDPDAKKKKRIVKYSYLYIIAIFLIAFLISVIAKLIIPYVVNVRYEGAEIYVFWIAIGYAVHGVYKILFPYLVHLNKTSFLGISTFVAAILNLLFNYIFINWYGAIGAAYATVLSFSVSAVMVFWYQNKYYKMPWTLLYEKLT